MNFLLKTIILCTLFASTLISQCDIEELRQELTSNDPKVRFWAVSSIKDCRLVEAVPELENLFQNEEDLNIQVNTLETLRVLGSNNLVSFAYDIINSSITPSSMLDINPAYAKLLATRVLFSEKDFSTINVVYDFIDNSPQEINIVAINLLEEIIDNLPSEVEIAKQKLIIIATNSNQEINRSLAYQGLFNKFSNEMISIGISGFASENSMMVRFQIFKSLLTVHYNELQYFLRENFAEDPNPSLRYRLVETLLTQFGSPSDLKLVCDYYTIEPDTLCHNLIGYLIIGFIPPKPDLPTPEMMDSLDSYVDQLLQFGWITDYNIYTRYKQKTEKLSDLYEANNYKEVCSNLNWIIAASENHHGSIFLTDEGYKFLHYYTGYIKENVETEFGACP